MESPNTESPSSSELKLTAKVEFSLNRPGITIYIDGVPIGWLCNDLIGLENREDFHTSLAKHIEGFKWTP